MADDEIIELEGINGHKQAGEKVLFDPPVKFSKELQKLSSTTYADRAVQIITQMFDVEKKLRYQATQSLTAKRIPLVYSQKPQH